MKYLFKESELPESFHASFRMKLDALLLHSGIVMLHGMAGVGISPFLRYLATRNDKTYIYVDVASLTVKNASMLFVAIGNELGISQSSFSNDEELLFHCKEKINAESQKKPLVLIINRFDELRKAIDASLLGNLRMLRQGTKSIAILLSLHSPLERLSIKALQAGNLDTFSTIMYYPPLSKEEIRALFTLYTERQDFPHKAFELSGGHNQLFHLLSKSTEKEILKNPYVSIAIKTLFQHFTYAERKTLEKIALGKTVSTVSESLLMLGVVKEDKGSYALFSPIVKDYLLHSSRMSLPYKEAQLFQLLKKREGKIVLKEDLFKALWSEEDEQFGSDWALNALFYRLRKHPSFIAKGFSIENYKKIGYMLRR